MATDANDPILGFATGWISALAKRTEITYVITMRAGRVEVPKNVKVYSIGKERGYSEPRRAIEFYRSLFRILRQDYINVCFSHMNPLFSLLAAPILKPMGIPIVTWYAHPSVTFTLKLAHNVSSYIVASLPTAYSYKHDKLIVVGQGIDTELFAPNSSEPESPFMILCVGRLSPVKDHPTLIKAAALLRDKHRHLFRVVILGAPASQEDESYLASLHKIVEEFDLKDIVHFEPAVPINSLPKWYRRCCIHVNLTPTGFGDKVAWEAMASGRPSVVSNEGFKETLGKYENFLLFRHRDPENLAERINWLLSLRESQRESMSNYLRQQVIKMHSLDRLSDRLIKLFHEILI